MIDEKSVDAAITDVLGRGVASFIDPQGSFRAKLKAKALGTFKGDVIVKFGVDPTKPDLHIGHAVILRALRRLQDMGCKVIFLVGDLTAQIGDPTGKSKVRPEAEFAEIEENMKTYLAQVGKILKVDPAVFSWIRNSDWFYEPTDLAVSAPVTVSSDGATITLPPNSYLAKAAAFEDTRMQKKVLHNKETHGVTLRTFLSVLRRITHSRLIERDMFRERIDRGEELYMHEMMYPVLQGLDSHILAKVYGACDLEVGGSDQLFNMVIGRDVMKHAGQEPQAVAAFDLLPGTDGVEKMSKSLGNYIGITDDPGDMFGKVMSVPDPLIPLYLRLATYTPLPDVERIQNGLANGSAHPRAEKAALARQIVAIYHGEAAAEAARARFDAAFGQGGVPEDAPIIPVSKGQLLGDVLYAAKLVSSKSEWSRFVASGAVSVISEDGRKIDDPKMAVATDMDIRVGKHRFAKVRIGA